MIRRALRYLGKDPPATGVHLEGAGKAAESVARESRAQELVAREHQVEREPPHVRSAARPYKYRT